MPWPTLPHSFKPRSKRRLRHYEGVLGTALELQLVAGSEDQLDTAETQLLAELERLEQVFSRFLPHSELNRLHHQRGQPVRVSPEFAALLTQAQRIMTLTGGAFHPAADTLARLWAVGEPDSQTLSGVLEQMRQSLWTLEHQHVTLHTELTLNFNAHAKGFITDAAAQAAFQVAGVREVVLNIGGDVRHLGAQSVPVGIEAPGRLADNREPLAFVRLSNQAVATSGLSHRGAHILDPRSGQQLTTHSSVSVLAKTCAEADALATAFLVLGTEESLRLADSLPNVGVLILEEVQGGSVEQRSNAFWRRHQTPSSTPAF
ncbi:FAD:protein FMN transferase [Deinococcus psychrotolerans]|uniref:FAD:protein FMN transferase n=1 Tax=Deinococcus psychrotolerans TaxID=2489213 RepID=A0A3G8YKA9_9DEIO|nr:FAD:protein FMN transferase [Deinococcus psychrotolerans]AZI41496.1 FAD:protein FMN transferase [Deinococcus psychrotolerans]